MKRATKTIHILFIVCFAAALALPMLFVNRVPNTMSIPENRMLAPFPAIGTAETGLNENLREDFTAWLGDNIGFRKEYVKVYARTKLWVFDSSPSGRIHIGKDGWYFYVPDYHLQIADGTYPLTEDILETIAENQQAIQEYYQEQGIAYFLMLTPAKTSIYPEYIGGGDYAVRTTPADIVRDYLEAHTDVQVISSKDTLLEHKDSGRLFLKQGTHWTTLGSYFNYRAMADVLNDAGVLSARPIDVEVADVNYGPGEIASMLSDERIFRDEIAPGVSWDAHSVQTELGEHAEAIREIYGDNPPETVFFENNSIQGGTLLIYGDSQIMAVRQTPQYMAEHFRAVASVTQAALNARMDEYVKPDVVILSFSERFIAERLPIAQAPPAG